MDDQTWSTFLKVIICCMALGFFSFLIGAVFELIKRPKNILLYVSSIFTILCFASIFIVQAYKDAGASKEYMMSFSEKLTPDKIRYLNTMDDQSINKEGQFVIYDIDKEKFIYFDTTDPNKADYIILLHRDSNQVNTYSDGSGAYVRYCDLKVIDIKEWEIVKTDSVNGGSPPSYKSGGGDKYGSKPSIQDIMGCVKKE